MRAVRKSLTSAGIDAVLCHAQASGRKKENAPWPVMSTR
jgi:hypothetical protein